MRMTPLIYFYIQLYLCFSVLQMPQYDLKHSFVRKMTSIHQNLVQGLNTSAQKEFHIKKLW